MTAGPELLVERHGRMIVLTLNRPAAANSLSSTLIRALTGTFEDLAGDPEAGVVVLTGAGRHFCAGLDLKELSGAAANMLAVEAETPGGGLVTAMAAFDRPIIGAINGPAVAGGFELALACDILLASTRAAFADTHARVGIMPGWGISQILPRRIGSSRAKELSFTGNFLPADRAESWGLVNRVVPPEELLDTARALAADILSCDAGIIPRYKRLIDEGLALSLGEGLALEARGFAEFIKAFSPKAVAERRGAIIDRGRDQKAD